MYPKGQEIPFLYKITQLWTPRSPGNLEKRGEELSNYEEKPVIFKEFRALKWAMANKSWPCNVKELIIMSDVEFEVVSCSELLAHLSLKLS